MRRRELQERCVVLSKQERKQASKTQVRNVPSGEENEPQKKTEKRKRKEKNIAKVTSIRRVQTISWLLVVAADGAGFIHGTHSSKSQSQSHSRSHAQKQHEYRAHGSRELNHMLSLPAIISMAVSLVRGQAKVKRVMAFQRGVCPSSL